MKKIFKTFIIIGFIFILGGCFDAKDKEFDLDGIKITLNEKFKKEFTVKYNYYYVDDLGANVSISKDKFEILPNIDNNKDYLEKIKEINGLYSYVHEKDDYAYFEYNKTENDTKYYVLSVGKKGKNEFWLVSFSCRETDLYTYKDMFFKFADSIEV